MRERDGAQRLGPQAWRAYTALRERIRSGELPRGTKLLPQVELASTLGVSLLTLRQALSHLEHEGLIVSEHGRGTFIRSNAPTVILLEDDELQQVVLATYVEQDGYKVLTASDPDQALLLVA